MEKIKAYCINLDKRPDRWDEFCNEDIPFEVERFSAISHQSGSIGCILSHLAVMEKCDDEILIFEDDFHLVGEWDYLLKAYNQLPYDWGCLYLGANLHAPLERYSDNLFSLHTAWSTHGILYNRSTIDLILGRDLDSILIHKNIDTFLAREIQTKVKCFIVYPLLSIQRPGYSDVINSHRAYAEMSTNFYIYTEQL